MILRLTNSVDIREDLVFYSRVLFTKFLELTYVEEVRIVLMITVIWWAIPSLCVVYKYPNTKRLSSTENRWQNRLIEKLQSGQPNVQTAVRTTRIFSRLCLSSPRQLETVFYPILDNKCMSKWKLLKSVPINFTNVMSNHKLRLMHYIFKWLRVLQQM